MGFNIQMIYEPVDNILEAGNFNDDIASWWLPFSPAHVEGVAALSIVVVLITVVQCGTGAMISSGEDWAC